MSQRTLIEINHDYLHNIAHESDDFGVILTRLLKGSGRNGDAEDLETRFGVRIFSRRHHGDAFDINFGGKKISEPYTP